MRFCSNKLVMEKCILDIIIYYKIRGLMFLNIT